MCKTPRPNLQQRMVAILQARYKTEPHHTHNSIHYVPHAGLQEEHAASRLRERTVKTAVGKQTSHDVGNNLGSAEVEMATQPSA